MKNRPFLATTLPMILLGALFVLVSLTVATQFDAYGRTFDEYLGSIKGRVIFGWYRTLGQDQSFLDHPYYMLYYGPFFEVVVATAVKIFQGEWHTRAIVNGIAGALGVLGIALCGWELKRWWGAFLAALGLWLYPRFYGAIFNNPKDIPAASATVFVLWSTLLLIRYWDHPRKIIGNSILVGFFIGAACAIRISTIVWYGLLFLLLAGWWLQNGKVVFYKKVFWSTLRKQSLVVAIIGATSFATTALLWPYVFLNPIAHFIESIQAMGKFDWNGSVLLMGQSFLALNIPWWYIPLWLTIASPLPLILLALAGCILVPFRFFTSKRFEPQIALIWLSFLIPLAGLIILKSTLYNGIRHFLFVIPSMVLLAVYALTHLFSFLQQRRAHIALIGLSALLLFGQLHTVWDMTKIHPYQYMYFNPLVGGIPGANGNYEMDYWGICNKPAAEWLAHNYQRYTTKQNPTVQGDSLPFQYLNYLPANFKQDNNDPDFYIWSELAPANTERFLSYKVIHTEGIQGYIACSVAVRPEKQ